MELNNSSFLYFVPQVQGQPQQNYFHQNPKPSIEQPLQPPKELSSKASRKIKFSRGNLETWNDAEIKKIFELYNMYGSQWKLISNSLPNRPTNSIKNRFYTMIRNMLKNLFFYHPQLPSKIPYEISSKIILRFYQAKEQFSPLIDIAKNMLRQINYSQKSETVKEIIHKYLDEVKLTYELIFDTHIGEAQPRDKKNKKFYLTSQCQQINITPNNQIQGSKRSNEQCSPLEKNIGPQMFMQSPFYNFGSPQFFPYMSPMDITVPTAKLSVPQQHFPPMIAPQHFTPTTTSQHFTPMPMMYNLF